MMDILKKVSKMNKADYFSFFKIIITCIPGKIYKIFSRNEIWIISERENDARDNGFWLFRYIRLNYPEIKVFYPINYKSNDYNKIKSLGNVIQFGSLKHHMLFWACHKNISAHIGNGMPNGHICFNLMMYNFYSFKNIFLQHGITCNNAEFLYAKNNKIDLFISAAQREREYIINQFGYPDDVVVLTGFCRFDNLVNESLMKQQILILPTWRYWFDFGNDRRKINKDQIFIESDYYKNYSALISSDLLADFCNNKNIDIIFYLHPDLQQYSHLFSNHNHVKIATSEEFDIQLLLKESNLLITDYSSVSFDFAYMKKPIIYFQFDVEKYREYQYKEGYFSYEFDGFGPVVAEIRDVISKVIESYADGHFKNNDLYLKRINSFYSFFDRNNTERVFQKIQEL